MAHKFKVVERPAKNKDGSDSKRKKVYSIIDRCRSGRRMVVDGLTSKKEVELAIAWAREDLVSNHLSKHPNDKAFIAKKGSL